jgi:hypothetical protein
MKGAQLCSQDGWKNLTWCESKIKKFIWRGTKTSMMSRWVIIQLRLLGQSDIVMQYLLTHKIVLSLLETKKKRNTGRRTSTSPTVSYAVLSDLLLSLSPSRT